MLERGGVMELLDLMKYRRSIRKYQDRQIPREALETIIEAGTYAPNAGGGQRSIIIGIRNAELAEKIGRLNVDRFDRSRLSGGCVSAEQPSIIDDPTMKSGFYGAPAVCVVFAMKNFLYSIPDAFCCAENMVLMAAELGISSCIIARGEETFDNETGKALLKEWNIPENYIARCFVLLGYCGGFYPFSTPEEFWAYWSRYIFINRYMDAPKPVYDNLLALVKSKDYFVITTNVDHCFQKAGFEKKRLFYTQGDYGLFQCSEPCCQETFDNESIIRQMMERQRDMRIPSELLPICPHCGKPMTMNLRSDDKFVEDEGWHRAAERYENFLRTRGNGRILFLELGVGYNTPVIIKYPFWRMTAQNPRASYACVNYSEASRPKEIADRSIVINGDIWEVVKELWEQK